ncbi:MAG: TIGR03915 family putative DNA repair protein [Fibrobacter sp.]|nr:TIGR03915 family putative DNA repair protein [Fibrobacter sp.]
MISISYDSSFDGFLSSIFEIYRQHLNVAEFIPDRAKEGLPANLFTQPFQIQTSLEQSQRIQRAITNAANADILRTIEIAFYSEESGVEMKIFAYLKKLFKGDDPYFARNPASLEMLPILQLAQSVRREAGNMLGMVRFSQTSDGTYFSEIEPKYDILSLIVGHFRGRFANERWAIYDSKRSYGVYYDKLCAEPIYIPDLKVVTQNTRQDLITTLWKDYYNAIAIKERENPRLLRRCLPVRYWKHLPEREPSNEGIQSYLTPSTVAKQHSLLSVTATR